MNTSLVLVVVRALQICACDFRVLEGKRTLQRQRELVAKGTSKTLRSRHLTGHAVDIVPLPLDWDEDYEGWDMVAAAMKRAGRELNVPVENGWDLWGWDRPHWQIPRLGL